MPGCAVFGCGTKYKRGVESVRLFSLPALIRGQCSRTEELSTKRRALWLSRLNRKWSGRILNGTLIKVCHRHFISGKPSALFDFTNPDWAPSRNLGHERKRIDEAASVSRYHRAQARRRKNGTSGTRHNIPDETGLEQSNLVNNGATTSNADATTSNADAEQDENFSSLEDAGMLFIDEQAGFTSGTDGTSRDGQGRPRTAFVSRHSVSLETPLDEPDSEAEKVPSLSQEVEGKMTKDVSCQIDVSLLQREVEWRMKKDMGCQTDFELQELPAQQRNRDDSTTQKTSHGQELAELQAKFVELLQERNMMSDQISSLTERVKSLATGMQELKVERDMFAKDNESMREENKRLKVNINNVVLDKETLRNDDVKTKFFTGIPTFELLESIYDFVEGEVPYSHRNALPKFTEFLITMMRLRLGLLEQDVAYRFNVSLSTVSKLCSRWINVMSPRLENLIAWPERDVLRRTVPKYFKEVFGDRFAVIIDCFEVFINRPSSLSPRAQTFSRYKHHNTVKFLIGITPQGTVCFVSEAWGGRASDKHITLHSGFLDRLVPGDVVLADRGFDIDEEVGMRQAKIAIPAFTKGATQLSFHDILKTREIANIRIHVERMIGFLKRKFRILGSMIPDSYLNAPVGTDTPPIDDIIKICCGLANMCPSLIPDRDSNYASASVDHPVLQLVFCDDGMAEPNMDCDFEEPDG